MLPPRPPAEPEAPAAPPPEPPALAPAPPTPVGGASAAIVNVQKKRTQVAPRPLHLQSSSFALPFASAHQPSKPLPAWVFASLHEKLPEVCVHTSPPHALLGQSVSTMQAGDCAWTLRAPAKHSNPANRIPADLSERT